MKNAESQILKELKEIKELIAISAVLNQYGGHVDASLRQKYNTKLAKAIDEEWLI